MDVSVIISAGRQNIGRLIESLEKQVFSGSFEIILVTHLDKALFSRYKNITLYTAERNNASLKRNLGVKFSSGRVIAFIDDDAYAPKDWLQKGYEFLLKNDSAPGVGGVNLIAEGSNFRERLTDSVLNFPFFGSGNTSYSNSASACQKAHSGQIHFVNCFILRDVFLSVGGINEAIGYGGEDTEFVYLVKHKLNQDIYFCQNLSVFHSRRPFGLGYLRQRFLFRFKNGQLSLAYPGIYLREPAFLGLLSVSFLIPFLVAVKPVYL